MANLRIVERQCFEELFGMASGYVLDFTNPSFSEFFREAARVDIYAQKYAINGDSKAKRLRAFIELEPDQLVGKVLSDLLEYWRYKTPQAGSREQQLATQANRVVERLLGKAVQPKDSADEFLKQDFGRVALQRIPSVGPLASVLEARLGEASRCLRANAPLAVIFHCGSVLEGLLLGMASAHPQPQSGAEQPERQRGKGAAVSRLDPFAVHRRGMRGRVSET